MNDTKKVPTAKIAVVSAGILALASVGSAYASHRAPEGMHGHERIAPEIRKEMKSAIESNDYNGFIATAEENGLSEVAEHMTEETFATIQERMASGEFENGSHRPGHMEHPRLVSPEAMESVQEAIEQNDFQAFTTAVNAGLTQDNFNSLVEAHNALQEQNEVQE